MTNQLSLAEDYCLTKLSPELNHMSPVYRILHQGGYTKEEQLEFRAVIFGNILQSALAIIRGMEMLSIDFGSTSAQVSYDTTYNTRHD